MKICGSKGYPGDLTTTGRESTIRIACGIYGGIGQKLEAL
jgi:hypothetical protein